MKVLMCSSEVVPFAKTGGLADVAGALPIALEKLAAQVIIIMPKYKSISAKTAKIGENVSVYFIENAQYFARPGLYGEMNGDYPDNLARFSFYGQKALELLKEIKFQPDVIHCHDWQSALIPLFLKAKLQNDAFYKNMRTIFTIHNIAYQGLAPQEDFPLLGLGQEYFTPESLEFYGKVNPMKAGIIYSDAITTVSPTYSREIQRQEFGYGLEGLLFKYRDKLSGIINGIDYQEWDPGHDKYIFRAYEQSKLGGKLENKLALQKEVGLKASKEAALVGMVGRLADQKGFDLVAQSIEEMLRLNAQIILLGTGDAKYHQMLEKSAKKYKGKISVNLRFDNALAHKIYAACDMFLMPSRFEPCGLGQMISFRYGTLPIVRKTGGLADTVFDYDLRTKQGNGFVFENYSQKDFLNAVKKAINVYKNKKAWQELVLKVMGLDFSWNNSAKRYLQLYQRLAG